MKDIPLGWSEDLDRFPLAEGGDFVNFCQSCRLEYPDHERLVSPGLRMSSIFCPPCREILRSMPAGGKVTVPKMKVRGPRRTAILASVRAVLSVFWRWFKVEWQGVVVVLGLFGCAAIAAFGIWANYVVVIHRLASPQVLDWGCGNNRDNEICQVSECVRDYQPACVVLIEDLLKHDR